MSDLVLFTSNEVGVNCISSLTVAEMFERRHDNVLQSIATLIENGEDSLNFQESSYKNEQNKTQPMCLLTETGFVLLVSSFNLKTEEHKVLRKRILSKFAEFQQNLIKRNLKLETAQAHKNEGKGKYGYILVDEGGRFPKKQKVLKEDHSEAALLQGKIQHSRDVIHGIELKISSFMEELDELDDL
jgi:Rha family phage regulatory protein